MMLNYSHVECTLLYTIFYDQRECFIDVFNSFLIFFFDFSVSHSSSISRSLSLCVCVGGGDICVCV